MTEMTETVHGINYERPYVYLIQESGLGVAELAARTCYDSFDNSENREIIKVNELLIDKPNPLENEVNDWLCDCNNIDDSKLLHDLAWVHHHHSIIEHTTLQFLVKGTSRGVLQEHARHRHQNISVRSTRYTMSSVINAFVASIEASKHSKEVFWKLIKGMDLFVTTDEMYNERQSNDMFSKLFYQYFSLGREEFLKISVSKSSLEFLNEDLNYLDLFKKLEEGKKKRNVGDAFKHIVNDNWRVDMVVSFNLRSLKNYLDLRDSGAAYFQIKWLAEEMKKVVPLKYLQLIDKKYRNKKEK
jgi:thymidylate synthase (FAD)